MKYCALYNERDTEKFNVFNELIIDYVAEAIEPITDFILEHQENQRIILRFGDKYKEEEIINALTYIQGERKASCSVLLWGYLDIVINNYLKKNDIPFFFEEIATNWDTVQDLISLGVSDIYIGEELGFSIPTVKKIAGDIQIRVYPNICQRTGFSYSYDIKSFFIRPEDLKEYEGYIDVIEFFSATNRQRVLYEIYEVDKAWPGPIADIITNFENKTLRSDCTVSYTHLTLPTICSV